MIIKWALLSVVSVESEYSKEINLTLHYTLTVRVRWQPPEIKIAMPSRVGWLEVKIDHNY